MKPRIVIFSAFLTPFRSGAEACAEEVALALADEFDITIITGRYDKELPVQDSLEEKVDVLRVGIGSSIDKWLFPFLAPLAARKLKPDIIHAVLESYAGAAMVQSRFWVKNAKRLLTCQSTNTTAMLKRMHQYADRVTVISSFLQERARKFGRTDAVLIPNGISFAKIQSECEKYDKVPGRVLFVGRLEKMKGVDTLLHAFAKVSDTAHLRIIGKGSQRSELERMVEENEEIRDRVTFAGYIPAEHVLKEFAQAEVFCGLSRKEALGNVFIEAQAAGCAVVAARTEGIVDIIEHNKNGILVPVDNPDAAAVALEDVLHNTELRMHLSDAAQMYAAQYEWSHIAERYAKVYREMLA